jgi:hypothetical protein
MATLGQISRVEEAQLKTALDEPIPRETAVTSG